MGVAEIKKTKRMSRGKRSNEAVLKHKSNPDIAAEADRAHLSDRVRPGHKSVEQMAPLKLAQMSSKAENRTSPSPRSGRKSERTESETQTGRTGSEPLPTIHVGGESDSSTILPHSNSAPLPSTETTIPTVDNTTTTTTPEQNHTTSLPDNT